LTKNSDYPGSGFLSNSGYSLKLGQCEGRSAFLSLDRQSGFLYRAAVLFEKVDVSQPHVPEPGFPGSGQADFGLCARGHGQVFEAAVGMEGQ